MFNRFRSLRLIISLLIVVSLITAACATAVDAAGSKQNSGATTKAPACKTRVTPTGTVRFSDWQFPDTLNPEQTSLSVSQEILDATFSPLFVTDNRSRLVPVMAANVPSVKNGGIKDGGRTFVVALKHGLRWSDGRSLTAQDIQFSLRVANDKAAGGVCRGTCDVIASIDAPNPYTAVFHLKHSYSPFLSYGLPPIWPRTWKGAWNNNAHAAATKLWQDAGFNFQGPNFPTNGPYQVAPGGFKADKRIELRPMKYYNVTSCGAYIKHLTFVYYTDKPSMIAAAEKHKTDVTQGYSVADIPSLQSAHGFHLNRTPSYTYEHLELNSESTYKGAPNPLGNANVREALALALDKTHLTENALSVSKAQAAPNVAWSFLINQPGLRQPFADTALRGQYDPVAKKYVTATGTGQALTDAKKLLSRTQFKKGFPLALFTTVGNPTRVAQAAAITHDWARLGVKVVTTYGATSQLFTSYQQSGTFATGKFQVAMFGFSGSPDPDQSKFNLQSRYCDRHAAKHNQLNANYSCMHDPVIDRSFQQGARSLDHGTRARAYAAAQVEMNKQAYWIGLYYRPTLSTDDGRVLNFLPNPTQLGAEWNVFDWHAKSSSTSRLTQR